jgi:hypothetical protein
MRIKTTEIKVYKFDELTDEQKQKAIEKLCDINVDFEWWQSVYMDAENIGLKITGFDIDRGSYCTVELFDDLHTVILSIIREHGEDCETYKTAKEFEARLIFNEDNEIENLDELEDEFLHSIGEDYRIILQHEYEYQTSEAAIIETIEANEYEFDEDGNIA